MNKIFALISVLLVSGCSSYSKHHGPEQITLTKAEYHKELKAAYKRGLKAGEEEKQLRAIVYGPNEEFRYIRPEVHRTTLPKGKYGNLYYERDVNVLEEYKPSTITINHNTKEFAERQGHELSK